MSLAIGSGPAVVAGAYAPRALSTVLACADGTKFVNLALVSCISLWAGAYTLGTFSTVHAGVGLTKMINHLAPTNSPLLLVFRQRLGST